MSALEIRLDTPVAECGGVASGSVRWSSEGKVRTVRVELGYRTAGSGNIDQKVVASHALGAGATGSSPFQLAVPFDGPISVEGQRIRVVWEVALVVDIPLGGDDRQAASLTVFPRGGLALWAQRTVGPPQ